MKIINLLISTSIGTFLGIFLAFGINSVLIQISTNAFFNVYYGILFFVFGISLLYRINNKNKIQSLATGGSSGSNGSEQNTENAGASTQGSLSNPNQSFNTFLFPQFGTSSLFKDQKQDNQQNVMQQTKDLIQLRQQMQTQNQSSNAFIYSSQLVHNPSLSVESCMLSSESNRRMVKLNSIIQVLFSIFLFCSSLLCFTLEKDWFKNIPAKSKIPSYALFGVSLAFTFIYAIVDFIQFIKDYFTQTYYTYYTPLSKSKEPLQNQQIIVSNLQIYLLLSMSFIIGALFGAIFGIVDVEDYYKNKFVLYTVLQTEISLCEPIGILLGAFTGFMLEFLRQQEIMNRTDEPVIKQFADSDEESEGMLDQQSLKTLPQRATNIEDPNTESDEEENNEELSSLIKI
ncbi:UNKNOWN [Stylonychia lemnae]|uniref:Transmembrane protein n=1 Tax=Stylonychia lemnae TaxID=5949 RepID=A0A078A810_STYLE|nr:UNKNOWN [Stylonychia lemnae]|eukprot:CDW78385.1 UNKNOWN [Stylonychia lemnae]